MTIKTIAPNAIAHNFQALKYLFFLCLDSELLNQAGAGVDIISNHRATPTLCKADNPNPFNQVSLTSEPWG